MIIFILVNIAQLIGILVPFVGCVSLIRKAHSRTSMYLLLANLGCLIINGSYMLLLQTKTYEGALIALKMEYFGNIVFYLMFGMFLWTYMKLKHYKWAVALISFWSIFDVLFLLAVWTGDPFHLAFQNLDFEWNANWGLVMLRSEPAIFYTLHGWRWHSLFYVRRCLLCCFLICRLILCRSVLHCLSYPLLSACAVTRFSGLQSLGMAGYLSRWAMRL